MAAVEQRVLPAASSLNSPFWAGARDGRLVIQRCNNCGTYMHPPGVLCGECGSERLGYSEVSGKGKLHSFTVYYNSPQQPPPIIGVVELIEQPGLWLVTELTSAVRNPEGLQIGASMHVEYESVSDAVTLPQFVLD